MHFQIYLRNSMITYEYETKVFPVFWISTTRAHFKFICLITFQSYLRISQAREAKATHGFENKMPKSAGKQKVASVENE